MADTPRRRRRVPRIAALVAGSLLLLLVLATAGALLYARPLLATGTGYAAHNACAVHFLAGRPADDAADDLPPNPLIPFVRSRVDGDPAAGTARATSSLLGVLYARTAWYTPGLGCTLADERPDLAPLALPDPDPEAPWPAGEAVDPTSAAADQGVDAAALDRVVDAAFTGDDGLGHDYETRAVLVVHDGRIVAERYGDGFDAATPQLGWSLTKSVTNTMIGRNNATAPPAQRLERDDDSLLPAWRGDARAGITVEDLLEMSSGLYWDETYDLGTPITTMLYAEPDMGAYAAAQDLARDPGEAQQYSSGTTAILCDLLQQRTGTGPEMARDLVFDPLGMTSAVLEPDASGGLACASYMWATPRDWARFGQWVLQDGVWEGEQLLPEGWLADALEPAPAPRATPEESRGFAEHWWVNRTADGSLRFPAMPADAFWASGHDGQRVVVVPSADLVVVRMGFDPEVLGDDLGIDTLVAGAVAAVG